MATKLVTTATLLRGSILSIRDPRSTPQNPIDPLRFEKGKARIIEDEWMIKHLEKMAEVTTDGDGEEYEKPTFLIKRGVPVTVDGELEDAAPVRKPTKLAADRDIKMAPRKPAGLKRRTA